MRAVLRSPVTYFLVIAIATVCAILVVSDGLADRAARDEAISEAESITEILAQSVVGPALPENLETGDAVSPTRLQNQFTALENTLSSQLFFVDRVFRLSIWTEDARLVYSTEIELYFDYLEDPTPDAGLRLNESQRRVLREGGVESEIADPDRVEDQAILADADTDGLVRVYTRMEHVTDDRDLRRGRDRSEDSTLEGEPLLLEAYFTLDEIDARQGEIYSSFRWITLAPLVIVVLVATLLLLALRRQLSHVGAERERLLRSAMDASDAERRRIARDLHDSVVQDLAGTAFSVSAVSRTPDIPAASRESLDAAGLSLRTSLKSLRSLLAEIHPPDLRADGLPAALADLTAPAAALDMQASVSVEGAETATDAHVALVWRVAQEAVRNAMRHSQASTLAVTVRGDGRTLTLEVVDDGIGFDQARVTPDSYGLRGLRSLVADSGGVLDVRSSPGEGTTVRMEVDAQ